MRIPRIGVAWRRLVLLVLYVAALVGVGGWVTRVASAKIGAAIVVVGLVVLVVIAFKSRNRSADAGIDASAGMYAGGGSWEVGAGSGGGSGGGDGGG